MEIRFYGKDSHKIKYGTITEDCINDKNVGTMICLFVKEGILNAEEEKLLYQFAEQIIQDSRCTSD